MKRNVVVLTMVLSLMVLLSSTAGVVADRGTAPHNGGCVAHCARAYIKDFNGDGKVQNCLVENMCHKFSPISCGEEYWPNGEPKPLCVATCVIAHGNETHGHGH